MCQSFFNEKTRLVKHICTRLTWWKLIWRQKEAETRNTVFKMSVLPSFDRIQHKIWVKINGGVFSSHGVKEMKCHNNSKPCKAMKLHSAWPENIYVRQSTDMQKCVLLLRVKLN